MNKNINIKMFSRYGLRKKITGILLLLSFCFTVLLAAPCGDVDTNGVINIVDALLTAQYYVGMNPQNFDQWAADVNGNGSIDIIDALLIAQYYVELITELPGCSITPISTPIPENDQLIGWASVSDCGSNGLTGGGDAAPITTSNGNELKELMKGSDPRVIYLSGKIDHIGNFSAGVKNKTLIGINNAEIPGGSGLVLANNIIVRNIKFSDGSNDSFGLSGSTCIWLDHCEFVDGADGNLDITNGANFITVSYCHFYYTKGHDHMLACLVGNTQPNESDVGKLKITFHHNLWGAGITSRQPRVRYGQVHVFNNYYYYTEVTGDRGSNYAIGGGYESKLVVENNYFENIGSAFTYMSDNGTAEVVASGNVGGSVPNRGSSFQPPYPYSLTSAEEAREDVLANAGVR